MKEKKVKAEAEKKPVTLKEMNDVIVGIAKTPFKKRVKKPRGAK